MPDLVGVAGVAAGVFEVVAAGKFGERCGERIFDAIRWLTTSLRNAISVSWALTHDLIGADSVVNGKSSFQSKLIDNKLNNSQNHYVSNYVALASHPYWAKILMSLSARQLVQGFSLFVAPSAKIPHFGKLPWLATPTTWATYNFFPVIISS